MSKSEDLMLVARVNLSGDKSAFDLLTRKYQSSIRRFFLNLTMGDNLLSDDLAQETFIKAYLSLNGFQGLSGFSPGYSELHTMCIMIISDQEK